jgi:hypothetical protein
MKRIVLLISNIALFATLYWGGITWGRPEYWLILFCVVVNIRVCFEIGFDTGLAK